MFARLQVLLFVFLLMFIGFCGGLFIGSLFIPKENGFAGSATVFWYGVAGLFIGLASGIFIIRVMKQNTFRVALVITVIISLLVIGWIVYRVKSINNRSAEGEMNFKEYDNKSISASFLHAGFAEGDTSLPAGMGIAKPHLSHGKRVYFYHFLPIGAQPYQIRPFDSLLIHKGENHFEIIYAPPWFFPEVMKLDYDLLLFRTITVSKYWMEVVVNKLTGITYWISRDDAEFIDWTNFLLNVYDVELIDPEKNPLRFKPLDHASIVATTPERFSLKPLAINGDWMMVPTLGLADRIVPYGWIRWRNNDKLLITYSLLS
jgi:hypothetical protein